MPAALRIEALMAEGTKTIVVTGSHSWLGRCAVTRLLRNDDYEIISMVTPWHLQKDQNELNPGVEQIPVDLSQPVSARTRDIFRRADWIFHFAWVRVRGLEQAREINRTIIDNIAACLTDPSRLVFISSVGGSKTALSTYGLSKWQAAEQVRALGGFVVVCGLVIATPPKGAHKLLGDVIRRLPVRILFLGNPAPVYPVPERCIGDMAQSITEGRLAPGTFRLFDAEPVPLNNFIAPKSNRIPVPVPVGLVLFMLVQLRRIRLLPWEITDKILTLLVKDAAYLQSLQSIPDLSFRTDDGAVN